MNILAINGSPKGEAFLRQKELLAKPYDKGGFRKLFSFKWLTSPEGRKLKIIDQQLYDRAAREGFPLSFFRQHGILLVRVQSRRSVQIHPGPHPLLRL